MSDIAVRNDGSEVLLLSTMVGSFTDDISVHVRVHLEYNNLFPAAERDRQPSERLSR